jgi:mycothiol synthase
MRRPHQGFGLGRQLSVAVLRRFATEGLRSAVLETQDFRLAAIATYLDLGFEPVPRDGAQERRWRTVFDALRTPRSM